MELINGVDRLPPPAGPLYLALGNFDGVHRGHQAIFTALVEQARSTGGVSAALVLNPHPMTALKPEKSPALLTDIVDRAEIMAELGLDYLIVEDFAPALAAMSPEQFVKQILVAMVKVKGVFIGENYKFGFRGEGDSGTLRRWGESLGFGVHVMPMIKYKGSEVSSSLIRSLIVSGAVYEAADYLNYYFHRFGRVIKGYGIGKKMVYPTANMAASSRLLWPGRGVYFSAVGNLDGGLLYGVTNVGARPTFNHYDTSVETHIIDFDGTIYNREIRLCFIEKLRDTRTFSSSADLKDQIGRDIEKGRELIALFKDETNGWGRSLQAGCSMLRSH